MFLHRSYCHCNWHCMKKQGFNPGTLKLCAFSNTSKSDLLQSQESMHLHQLPNTYLSMANLVEKLRVPDARKKKALLAKMGNLPHIPKQLPFPSPHPRVLGMGAWAASFSISKTFSDFRRAWDSILFDRGWMYNHGKGLTAHCVPSEGCVEDISFLHTQRTLSMRVVGVSLCDPVIHCRKSTLPGQGSAIHPARTPQRPWIWNCCRYLGPRAKRSSDDALSPHPPSFLLLLRITADWTN